MFRCELAVSFFWRVQIIYPTFTPLFTYSLKVHPTPPHVRSTTKGRRWSHLRPHGDLLELRPGQLYACDLCLQFGGFSTTICHLWGDPLTEVEKRLRIEILPSKGGDVFHEAWKKDPYFSQPQYKCWWKNFTLPETNSKRASSPPNKMASQQGSASHHQFSGANLLLVSGTRVFLPLHPLFQPSFLMIFRALWSWSQMTHQIFGHQFGCFQK